LEYVIMEPFRGRLHGGDRLLLDGVEGGIQHRPGAQLSWGGYLIIPRERLEEVTGAGPLCLEIDGRGWPLLPDPVAAGPAPVVVMAFQSEGSPAKGG